MSQKNRNAIVTLAVGDDYVAGFMKYAEPTWRKYCTRHGYDAILLTDLIDTNCDFSKKSIHWQKLLVGILPQLQDYDRVVWVDGDILINHRMAPSIVEAVTSDKIGVIDASPEFHYGDDVYNLHSRFLILNYLMKMKMGGAKPGGVDRVTITDGDLASYYKFLGFEEPVSRFINTGVFVFEPKRHGAFLAGIYQKYDRDYMDFENTPLSYEFQANDAVEYVDGRFNHVWRSVAVKHYPFLFNRDRIADYDQMLRLCANVTFRNSYFMHFAGGGGNPVIKDAFSMIDTEAASAVQLAFPDEWEQTDELIDFQRLDGLDKTGRGILF
ncbi:MAG: hypothetical protein ACTSV1_07840 [Alphaproteobacteria bacterium]